MSNTKSRIQALKLAEYVKEQRNREYVKMITMPLSSLLNGKRIIIKKGKL